MQERALSKMSETTMSTAFGNSIRPEHLLKAVYIGNANSKRGDIFTEIPLNSTDDALFYMQAIRSDALRGSSAGDRAHETINQYYDGETYVGPIGTGTGALQTFTSAPVSPIPIIPFKCSVLVNGTQVAVDNGGGILVGLLLDPSGTNTVDYASGVFKLAFLVAPALGAVITVVFNWNSELAGNYGLVGKISLELTKTRFNARPMSLGYSFTDLTQIMFETTGLGNFDDMISQAVGDEHARATDYRAIALARQVALSNPITTFDTNFANAGEISFKSHAQRVTNEVGKVSVALYNDIKRGEINKIVCDPKSMNYLTNHDTWQSDSSDFVAGVRKAGTLNGNIEVFVCPQETGIIGEGEMIMTYKNANESLDLGIVYGQLTSIHASLKYPNFYTEGNSATIEDSKVINSKFVRMLKLTSL